MDNLTVQCPTCQTRYRVTPGQLRIANGQVRCGQCLSVFQAQPAEARAHNPTLEALQATAQDPSSELHLSLPGEKRQKVMESPLRPGPKTDSSRSELPQLHESDDRVPFLNLPVEPVRLYVAQKEKKSWAPACLFLGASLLAVSLLASQYLWFERQKMGHLPQLSTYYAHLCRYLDCALPSRSAYREIQLHHLQVSDDPDSARHLRVQVILENQAAFVQPFPRIRLTLSDQQGRRISVQDRVASDYLAPGHFDALRMPTGQRLEITLHLARPIRGELGYQLDLLPAL
ncbi:DUF3426 domain-containing protein [Nitrincola tapanii]|uniref:DUF3426 domain-containing protein n=1 Tax=Nitrincola tapanii TaxID=1708751 RepID=A0A5A9W023_9GAMM|nr:DUF3426 domain-containing protein [Nitrincola tapanii]KAA0873844.1 DUF3426 domain-containing protein [Nitrincola tapanii]